MKILFSKFKFLVLLLFTFPSIFYSQINVTGNIKDVSSNEDLIGVYIVVQDTSVGVVSDIDGNYKISIPKGFNTLIFTYVGYQKVIKTISDSGILNIKMTQGQLLDEVVVIGYGTVKRKDITGSLKSVSAKDFNKGAVTGPQQLLAGKIPGVSITTDGSPGGGSAIRIRGESSLSATNDPLIVIDGIPLDNTSIDGGRNNLNFINPNDIETMTVLKDASATAIYGNRASAGVILITTKKGKLKDGLRIGYSSKFSIGKINNYVDVLKADEFRTVINNKYTDNPDVTQLLSNASTDWQKEIYQNAFGQDHNLNFSGGIGEIPFRASLGYTDNNGLLKTDNFNRFSGSINLTPGFINNTLQFKLGLKASKSKNHFADKGAIGSAIGFDPTKAVKSDNSKFGGYNAWFDDKGEIVGLSPANPVALLEQKNDDSELSRYVTNASIDYRLPFLPALRANLNLGYDYSTSNGTIYIDTTAAFAYNTETGGGTDNTYEQTLKNKLLEFYLNYKEKLFGNSFDVMLGYSWQNFYKESKFHNSDIRKTEANIKDGADAAELYMLSIFGRVNYNINDFTFLTATIRQDHTSRFAPDNRVGLFPAVGLAFQLLENNNSYFNNVKARLGWGVTGQQDIGGYYLYQGLYQKSFNTARYQFGDNFTTTYRPNGYDSGIKWETTTTYNVGIDFSIIKNRLSGSVEFYKKDTKDLLNNSVQVPVGSNLTNIIATNIGNMKTNGFEISFNTTPILIKNFSWDFNINASTNKSEITKLNSDENSIGDPTGGISGGVGNTIQINSVGYAPASFFVYEQKYDESAKLIPGEFVDRNGDGEVNELDKYRLETSRPKLTLGLSNNITYKKISLSFAGRAHFGNQVYNNVQTDIGWQERLYNLSILNNIHRAGIDNNIEKQEQATYSDAYVQDASFFKLDHVTLGYNFENLIGKNFRIYATVQNAFVLTKYKGLDPEVFGGIDNNIYPRPRNYVLGLSVNF